MKKKNKTQKNNFFSLSKLDKVVFKIEEYLIIFFTSVALLTGCLQVIFRYVFNWGVTWSETAFVISTIIAMFIAGSRAIRDDQHISVDVFVLLFRKKIQNFLIKLSYSVFLILCIYYFFAGLEFVKFSKIMDIISPETGVKEWIFYSTIPFAMTLFSIRLFLKIFQNKSELSMDRKIKNFTKSDK